MTLADSTTHNALVLTGIAGRKLRKSAAVINSIRGSELALTVEKLYIIVVWVSLISSKG